MKFNFFYSNGLLSAFFSCMTISIAAKTSFDFSICDRTLEILAAMRFKNGEAMSGNDLMKLLSKTKGQKLEVGARYKSAENSPHLIEISNAIQNQLKSIYRNFNQRSTDPVLIPDLFEITLFNIVDGQINIGAKTYREIDKSSLSSLLNGQSAPIEYRETTPVTVSIPINQLNANARARSQTLSLNEAEIIRLRDDALTSIANADTSAKMHESWLASNPSWINLDPANTNFKPMPNIPSYELRGAPYPSLDGPGSQINSFKADLYGDLDTRYADVSVDHKKGELVATKNGKEVGRIKITYADNTDKALKMAEYQATRLRQLLPEFAANIKVFKKNGRFYVGSDILSNASFIPDAIVASLNLKAGKMYKNLIDQIPYNQSESEQGKIIQKLLHDVHQVWMDLNPWEKDTKSYLFIPFADLEKADLSAYKTSGKIEASKDAFLLSRFLKEARPELFYHPEFQKYLK